MSKQRKRTQQVKQSNTIKTPWSVKKPIYSIILKFSLFALFIFVSIFYSDSRGIFNPDNTHNHTKRKWDSYYEFSKKNNVDVLLVGNSHLYTGINPKNLSTSLGCNAFILASPGTGVADHYFTLEEALKVNNPKLVIIETYGLHKSNQYLLTGGALSDLFKSFSARKNLVSKIIATPFLFSLKNYPYAWSNTLRNHDYTSSNFNQIKQNIEMEKNNRSSSKNKKLYLGRYVRFQTGIEDTLLLKYEKSGAPVDGLKFEINTEANNYIQKITDLCKSKDIELIFLTLPMYQKHVSNYSNWKKKLAQSLGTEFSSCEYWIDMQLGKGYEDFSIHCFENTYATNQHMTYNGSLLATYKLSDFILEQKRIMLPNRRKDKNWIKLFYFEEGFFENNSPRSNDKYNITLFRSDKHEGLNEILLLKRRDFNTLLVKFIPTPNQQYSEMKNMKVRLNAVVKVEDLQPQSTFIELPFDIYHSKNNRLNFSINIQPIEVLEINDFSFVN